jgi:K(+)-stimulated pyrophosphate-energized sodium pump
VALNPVIKFATLFGVLAVGLAIKIESDVVRHTIAGVSLLISMVFVYRSFYGMRIESSK